MSYSWTNGSLPGSPRDCWERGTEPFDPLGAVGDASAPGGGIGSLGELELLLQGLILLAEVNQSPIHLNHLVKHLDQPCLNHLPLVERLNTLLQEENPSNRLRSPPIQATSLIHCQS